MGLGGRPPIGFRFPVGDVEVQDADDGEGDEGRDPVHEEHDPHAKEGAEEGSPHVVVLEGRPPPRRLGDGGVKHGEVDQGVGRHEEVGQEGGDDVQLADEEAPQRDQEDQKVASKRVLIGTIAL